MKRPILFGFHLLALSVFLLPCHAQSQFDSPLKLPTALSGTFAEIRDARPDIETARKALADLLEAVKFANCTPQTSYIESICLR